MKRFGIVSYNIYANFTNYGSALQSWALHQAINRLKPDAWESVLIDYCPDVLKDKDPLNPMKNMWDQDAESLRMCELSLPAIRENYWKFDAFYRNQFHKTAKQYGSENFNEVVEDEQIDGFVCGSDTIFCIDEFGFDDGYYANYPCMREGHAISYAASFGDAHFNEKTWPILNERLQNFAALGIRENQMIPYVQQHVSVPVCRVIDPTLLLEEKDYHHIAAQQQSTKKYVLLYARRYNPKMEAYAHAIAEKNEWEVIEISLRATNAAINEMRYDAGVEEFLALVRDAQYVVTNSYHGMIFSVQFRKPFAVFSREQCDNKIMELLDLFGLSQRMQINGERLMEEPIDYESVHKRIAKARKEALAFLNMDLSLL